MHRFIAEKQRPLSEICRRHHVRRLDVFGSATGEDFDPARSDVDLIVEFHESAREQIVDDYFGLKADLEALFGRPVDLLTSQPIRNPYLRESIERSRQTVYAA